MLLPTSFSQERKDDIFRETEKTVVGNVPGFTERFVDLLLDSSGRVDQIDLAVLR